MILICSLAALAAPRAQERITLSLDGTWQIADSVTPEEIPAAFDHTAPVPGLANLAAPPFPDVDRFFSRELANHPNFRHKNLPEGAKDAPVGISLQKRNCFWYRRSFRAPAKRQVAILKIGKAQFGTAVWLNGKKIGEHLGCFSAGYFNLSDGIRWEQDNVLDVRIGAHPAALPPGAPSGTDLEKLKWTPGIYDTTSVFFSDNPVIESIQVAPRIASSEILVQTVVKNYGVRPAGFELGHRVNSWKEGSAAGQAQPRRLTLAAGEEKTFTQTIRIRSPRLWTPEDPFLYALETGTGGDSLTTRFGMREFRFDAATGRAYLNGKPYFLRGSNITLHRFLEDPNCGSLPWQEQWVRRLLVDIPKQMHWNSFRFCIGPVPDRWLELADEAGLLIQNEFYLWTFGETFHKEWSMPELIKQYGEWMRDNWNHPSVAIWNSNNETVAPYLNEKVLPAVRPLDLSNRPWDNGWSAPNRPDDPVAEHLYIIGGSRFKWTDLEQPPNRRDRRFGNLGNPAVVNEFGELWLNRDGTPTVLTEKIYDRMLGANATPEERLAANGYYLAGLTEYWRACRQFAGVLHFVYLTASFPGVYTSDHFRNLEKLELDPHFADYVGEAFKPLGVYLSFWQPELKADSSRTFKVSMVNDRDQEASGKLVLSLETEAGQELARAETAFSILAAGQSAYELALKVPKTSGLCLLKAAAYPAGTQDPPTLSRRKVTVTQ
jgi:hypothetical protein